MAKNTYKNLFFHKLALFAVLSPASYAVGDLWLPISYQTHFNRLLEASKIASGDPSCYELLKGRLAESRSTKDHLIFKFYCRSENRSIFTILVDSTDLSVTNMPEELARLRKEAKQKARDRDLQSRRGEMSKYWKMCHKSFKKETRLFDDVKVQTALPPPSEVSPKGNVFYQLTFQAKSLQRKPIIYSVTATVRNWSRCEIDIRPM